MRRVDNAQDALNVTVAEAEAVSPALMKAVIACKKQRPDRSQLLTFLPTPGKLKWTGICGLFKLALTLKARCNKQLPLCQAIIKSMHTAALTNHYENEMAVMVVWIDGVLCQSFAKSGVTTEKIVELWGDVIKLVVARQSHKMER